MTFKELMDILKELESLGIDLNEHALVATEDGVRKVKSVFTNGQRTPFLDIRR